MRVFAVLTAYGRITAHALPSAEGCQKASILFRTRGEPMPQLNRQFGSGRSTWRRTTLAALRQEHGRRRGRHWPEHPDACVPATMAEVQ